MASDFITTNTRIIRTDALHDIATLASISVFGMAGTLAMFAAYRIAPPVVVASDNCAAPNPSSTDAECSPSGLTRSGFDTDPP